MSCQFSSPLLPLGLLDAAALRRAAPIVRNGRDILDLHNVQTRRRQRPNRGFTSRSRPFNPNFDALHPILITRYARSRHGGLLRGIGSAFTRAFETNRTCRRPTDRAAVRGGNGHNRVVKGRLNTGQTMRHHTPLALLFELLLALRRFPCCRCWCSLLGLLRHCVLLIDNPLLASHYFLLRSHSALARTLPRAGIGMRALSAYRQIAPMAKPSIALNLNQPANVHLDLFAEIALDAAFGFDLLTELVYLFFGKILDLLGLVHFGLGADRAGAWLSNAIDRGQTDP